MKIVCLGSSSVEGVGDSKGLGWVGRLNEYLHKDTPANYHRVFNLGLMGDTVAQTAWRYSTEVLPRNPQLVIIFTGTNDCQKQIINGQLQTTFSSEEKYMFDWFKFAKQLKSARHKTIIVGPTMVNEEKGPMTVVKDYQISFYNEDVKKYNDNLKEFCLKQDMPFLELFDLFADNVNAYTSDIVHPNDLGYDKIFEKVKSYLEENNFIK